MIDAITQHEIQVLRAAGVPERTVAQRTAVSVRSVERISKEPPVTSAIRTVRVGRPSLTAGWAGRMAAWLAEDRTVPGMELLRRAHEAGYAGGKSALYELIRRLRPTPAVPVVRFEGVPGEFSQHDFGQCDVRYVDGHPERVHFFASRLKWSRAVDVRLVPNEQEEASSALCSAASRRSAASRSSPSGTIRRRSCRRGRATGSSGMPYSARSRSIIASRPSCVGRGRLSRRAPSSSSWAG